MQAEGRHRAIYKVCFSKNDLVVELVQDTWQGRGNSIQNKLMWKRCGSLTSQKHAIDGYSDKDSFSVDQAIPTRLTWESSY